MNRKNQRLCLLGLFVIAAAVTSFGLDRAHFIELNKQGRDLKKKQDWPAVRQVLVEIGKEMPGLTPLYTLRMAAVETHLGNKSEALRWVKRYADMGLTYDLSSDEELKPLLAEAGWKSIGAQMEHNRLPVMHASQVCILPIADLMPEDLTFDKVSGSVLVSSIQHRSLYRASLPRDLDSSKGANTDCELHAVPLDAQTKQWPVMAVSFDPARDLVWMTSSAISGFSGLSKEDEGKAALLAVDALNGKIIRRLDLASDGPAVLGDMSVSANGTVYVTDSAGGGVYRVQGTGDKASGKSLDNAKLEKIAEGLFSPQTPVLAADGKRLFVPEYPLGIAVIDLSGGGKITHLSHPDNIAVTGLDGMHLVGDSLIGVQNGTEPERVMRFHLNHAQTEIESAEIIAQSPHMGEPTHAVAVNGWVYVLANVGWDKIDDSGKLKEGSSFTPPVLLRFPADAKGNGN